MTDVLGNNGYNGYVAGNPPPQLQECGNANTNDKDNFQLSALLFVIASLIPLIPSGSFFTTYSATLFWINFSIMMPSIIKDKSEIINN